MLTNRHYLLDDEPDFVHNYYERLVLQEAHNQSERIQRGDREFLADVACVALNRLPPRYIRHDVDMTFFMSPQDMMEIERKVAAAVSDALNYVERREQGENPELLPIEASLSGTRASKTNKASKAEKSVEKDNPATPAKTTTKAATKSKTTKKK